MDKITCVIVEDESSAIQKLTSFIQKVDYLNLLETFYNVTDAYNWLNSHKTDLIFLDLHLGELIGFDLLKNIDFTPLVIITTAFSEHALESYQYFINAYLLKPYSFADFLQVLNKLPKPNQNTELHKDYVFIKTEYRLEKIMLNEVLYLEGMKDYIKIVTADKQIMTLMNFKEITEIFNNPNFCRVHHSFIAAVDKIDFIERNRVIIKEKCIPISESKRENFFKMINKQ